MGAHDEAPSIQPIDRAAWRAWLNEHHDTSTGVWVVTYKKAARKPSPSYEELVLEGLCFGWIDSRPGRVDDERTKLYFCPRKKGSVWAATNKVRVDQLIAQGLMTPAGQRVIDRAKSDGSWSAIDASEAVAFSVVIVSVILTFFPIHFLHPVRVKRLRKLNLAVFLLWSLLGGISLLMHFRAPDWVEWGVIATGLYLYVIGFILQLFPKLGR